jgi:site-specific recombinase XerD
MNATSPDFPRLLQDFFLRWLVAQRGASRHTVASYRDTFELFLRFVEKRTGRCAATFTLSDIDAPVVLDFLDHIEQERRASVRTRNVRLTAIRSFARYAASRDPASLPVLQRLLAIPTKRCDRPVLGYLSREEMQAVLDAPDPSTWSGRRDVVLLTTLYNTGARVSEVTALRVADVLLDRQTSLLLHGKGRKERLAPLWPNTARSLRDWLTFIRGRPEDPLFPNRQGKALNRSGVRQRLDEAVRAAAQRCPSLAGKRVSPHSLRHTTAMHLLQAGVDLTVIALLLGHEDVATTHRYLESDLAMKQAALDRIEAPTSRAPRFRASRRVLAFLDQL